MLPTAHSPPGRGRGSSTALLPPLAQQALDYTRRTPSAACGAGFVLALLLTRLFSGGGSGTPCLPSSTPPSTHALSAAILPPPSPPTAYIRLDQAVSTGTSTRPWASVSATGPAAVPRSNALLGLARAGEGGGGSADADSARLHLPEEGARPRGAPALPPHPAVSVVIPVVGVEAAAAAASTAAAATAAGGTVEVVVVASTTAAAKAFGEAAGPSIAFRLLTRTGPVLNDPSSAYAAALNDGVRAARAPLVAALAPGDRVGRGAWAALAAGAAAHPDADVFYTGVALVHRPDASHDDDDNEPFPAEPPWWSPVPAGAVFRKERVWAAGGGFPAVPAPGRSARAAAEVGLWAGAAAAHGGTLAAVSVGPDALVVAAPDEAASLTLPPDLAAAVAVAMAGGPLPPAAVLRAHTRILHNARHGSPHRDGLAAAATALARATAPRGCPATAPTDLLLGLLHEAAGDARMPDASAAYARAVACADGAGIPALAWAARVRGDAARAADLARCVRRAEAAAEPGSAPRPEAGNARADAAECVAVLGVAT